MHDEIRQDTTPSDFKADEINVNIDTDETGAVTSVSVDKPNDQWQQIGEKISILLSDLPEYFSAFFAEYRQPIITIGLIIGGVIGIRLILAILDSVNDIPLLAPSLELIGLFYAAWFVYRYLLKASTRKELTDDFNSLKEQVLGDRLSKK
jgi:hypothetical protein